jgi:hypothetical protein
VLVLLLSIQVDGTKHLKTTKSNGNTRKGRPPLTKKLRKVDRPRESSLADPLFQQRAAPGLRPADDSSGNRTEVYAQLGEEPRGPKLEKEENEEKKEDLHERVIKHDSRCSIIGRSRDGDWYKTDCGATKHHNGDKTSEVQLSTDSATLGVYLSGDSIDRSQLRLGLPVASPPPQLHGGDDETNSAPSASVVKEKEYSYESKSYEDAFDNSDKTSNEVSSDSTRGGVYHFGGIDPQQLLHGLPIPSASPPRHYYVDEDDDDESDDEPSQTSAKGKGPSVTRDGSLEGPHLMDQHGGTTANAAGSQHHAIITPYQELYLKQKHAQSSGGSGEGGKGGKGGKSSGKGKSSSKSGKGKKHDKSGKKGKKHGKKKGGKGKGKGKGETYHYEPTEFEITTDHPSTTHKPYPQPSLRPVPRPSLRLRPTARPSFGQKPSDRPVIVDPPPRKPDIPFTSSPTPKRQDDASSFQPVRVRRRNT